MIGLVSSFIGEMLKETSNDTLIKENGMMPFEVKVLRLERTLCEKIMSLVRFSKQADPYRDLSNKVRHVYDIHQILKDSAVAIFFESNQLDQLLQQVGYDDIKSFRNNNEWLNEHPSTAIIFEEPKETWSAIRSAYHGTFKDLVTGKMPSDDAIVETLQKVSRRLQNIPWNIKRDNT